MTEAESYADRPGPEVVLAVATALAERMGGAAPVAMICLDPQVLEYGRELIDKKESAGRISLRQALEDILQGQGKDSKLRIEEGEPFPMELGIQMDVLSTSLVWQSRSARATSPLLQRELQRASTAQQVLAIVGTHFQILDARNVSFAFQKIAALQATSACCDKNFQKLLGSLECLVPQLDSKELAKLCSSLSTLRVKGDESGPWSSIITEVTLRLHASQLTELDICESLRALARVPDLRDLRAFEAAESMEVATWMSFHGTVIVMWAMATATYPLSTKLLGRVHSQLSSGASDETLKLIAVAAGKGQRMDTGQLMTLVARLVEVAYGDGRAVSPPLLRTLIWASVKASAVGVAVSLETLKELADQGCEGLPEATAADIVSFAWAVACVEGLRNHSMVHVLQASSAEALKRRDFDAQHLATLLWALATAGSGAAGSSASALAQRLAPHVAKLPEKLLLRTSKAQVKLTAEAKHLDRGSVLLDSICNELLRRTSSESEDEHVSPSTVSSIACALAESPHLETQRLCSTLEPILVMQAGSLPPNHLARLAVAAAQLEEPLTKLVGALVAAVSAKARQLHPKDLQRVAKSLAEMKVADCQDLATCSTGSEHLSKQKGSMERQQAASMLAEPEGTQPKSLVRLVREDAVIWNHLDILCRSDPGPRPRGLLWLSQASGQTFTMGTNCSRIEDDTPGVLLRARSAKPIPVYLHIYNLGSSGQMSFVNTVLKPFDSGAFHCGVEVYGLEWSFSDILEVNGERSRTGVFSSWPKLSPGHQFVETVNMGCTNKTEVQVLYTVAQMEADWPISEYNILRKNCCHFADALCKELGVGSVPQRVLNLSKAGASVVDVAHATCCSRPKACGALSCCYGAPVEKMYQEVYTTPRNKDLRNKGLGSPKMLHTDPDFQAEQDRMAHEALIVPVSYKHRLK
eukprot:s2830_g4.t2